MVNKEIRIQATCHSWPQLRPCVHLRVRLKVPKWALFYYQHTLQICFTRGKGKQLKLCENHSSSFDTESCTLFFSIVVKNKFVFSPSTPKLLTLYLRIICVRFFWIIVSFMELKELILYGKEDWSFCLKIQYTLARQWQVSNSVNANSWTQIPTR